MYCSTSQTSTAGLSQGDTQVEPSYVYEQYIKKGRESLANAGPKESNGCIAPTKGTAPETYGTRDTGHIDLVHSFELEKGSGADKSENGERQGDGDDEANGDEEDDFDELSQDRVDRVELYPEARRFQQPKTPATHGKKRNHNGEILTPTLPTNPFGNVVAEHGDVMALSQVFGATQAASSPLLQRIPSDQVSERPSPNLFDAHNPTKTAVFSSPLKFPEAVPKHIPGEPMATYISMVESQEERERLRRIQAASSPIGAEDYSSDDGFSSDGSSRARRQRLKARRELAIQRTFAGVTAPPRGGRITKGQHKKGGLEQSTKKGASLKNAMLLSDDLEANTDGRPASLSDNEIECEWKVSGSKRRREPETSVASNGRAQHPTGVQVPRTSSRAMTGNINFDGSQSSPSSYRTKDVSLTATKPAKGILIEPASGQVSHNSSGSTEKFDIIIGGTQTIAVEDSQPSPPDPETSDIQPPDDEATSGHPASVDSHLFTSQSQFNSLSKNARPTSIVDPTLTVVANSSIPQPPQSPSQIYNSSPLITRHQSRRKSPGVINGDASPPSAPGCSRPVDQCNEAPRETVGQSLVQNGQPEVDEGFGADRSNIEVDKTRIEGTEARSADLTPPRPSSNLPQTKGRLDRSPATRSFKPPRTTRILRGKEIPETSPAGGSESTSPANDLSNSEPLRLRTRIKADDPKRLRDSPGMNVPDDHRESLDPSLSMNRTEHRLQSPSPVGPVINSTHGPSRTLTEIAADPSPPDPLGDIDMDLGLFTSKDVAFQATINGSSPVRPARKRRRGVAGVSVDAPKEQGDRISPEAPLSSDHHVQNNMATASNSSNVAPRPGGVLRKYGKSKPLQSRKKLDKTPSTLNQIPASKTRNAVTRVSEVAEVPPSGPGSKLVVSEPTRAAKTKSPSRPGPPVRLDPEVLTGRNRSTLGKSPARDFDASLVVPGRVLAWFRGRTQAYYPATCIREEGAQPLRHVVRFDDGTIDTLDPQHLRRLEFRIGDTVKVDLDAFRTKNYVVSGFKDRLESIVDPRTPSKGDRIRPSEAQKYPLTDVYGHATLSLTPKKRESSVGNGQIDAPEMIEVPITSIYITSMMWGQFTDRAHLQLATNSGSASRLHTPALQPSAPNTPSSRTRQRTASAIAPSKALVMQTGPLMKGSGLFSSMAFAVTYLGEDHKKDSVIKQITHHGGRILLDGFEELFDLDGLQPLTPSNAHRGGANQSLSLTREAETLGFVCLIADKHSRRVKYIQALALGLPCLSGRWIADCVAKNRILDWEPYLLPSGESSFLNGATRSRFLQTYPAESARFSNIIDRRSRLLKNRSVLLVMGKGKAEEPRKAYLFLTYVLGASRVSRVVSVEAARKALAEDADGWDWLYVDRNEASVEKALLAKPEVGKKRKRGADEDELGGECTVKKKVKAVGNEFVIQSLILGRLLDED